MIYFQSLLIESKNLRFAFLMSLFCLSIMNAQVEYDSEDILHGTNAGLKNRWFTKFSGKIVHGNVYTDYGNSRMLNGFMRAGFKHGKWKEWYDTGMIKSIQHFTFGKEDGIQKEWYDNGKLMRESDMKGDTLYRYHKEFYPSGQIKLHQILEFGALIEETRWDTSGTILKREFFEN